MLELMNKKSLYIHIGCEKTGTTSIQNVLADNRGTLMQQGVLYPDIGKLKFAQLLLPAALQPLMNSNKPRADYYPGNEFLDTDTVWNDFINLARNNTDKNIIISAEHFSSRVNGAGLQYMKNRLSELSALFNVRIITYLRRQDKFMESSYSTIIKAGGKIGFDSFYETHIGLQDRYDFSLLLERWSNAFGKSAMIVRDYETEVKSKGLLNSFFEITGIEGRSLSLENENENVSWPASIIELARLCNTPRLSTILGNQRVTFLDAITKTLQAEERKKVYRFNAAQRQAILDRYKESNKRVEQEYFDGSPLFSELATSQAQQNTTLSNEINISKMDIVELFSHFYSANTDKFN